jgi:hypothetical protein
MLQKVAQLPLIRLILGFLIVFMPVAIEHMVIGSLPLSRLWRSILVVAFTLPVSYGAYYILVHFIEHDDEH